MCCGEAASKTETVNPELLIQGETFAAGRDVMLLEFGLLGAAALRCRIPKVGVVVDDDAGS